jgi:hypothetical protein
MFKAPNYVCRVKEKEFPLRKPSRRLVYAQSEAAARTFLEGKDYEVLSVQSYDFEVEWKAETDDAIAEAKKRHKDPTFDFPSHWSILKEHLQDLFQHRCAYCDGPYEGFGYGDVEHYRPKGRVAEEPAHPGYWWLAYDPSNYLPSCQLCNQKAKKNYFPIAGKRALGPGDSLEDEGPLLLRSDRDRWFDHVRFRPSTDSEKPAYAEGLTTKGKSSIKLLELNRRELCAARQTEQQLARGEYVTALNLLVLTASKAVLQSVIERYEFRSRPFHAAAMDEINSYASIIGFPTPYSRNGNGSPPPGAVQSNGG